MDYAVVCAVALLASGLTLVSGFGLGTLLLPAFAAFFPLPTAVALTAIVHLANNLFKLGLVGLHADRQLVLRFGLPALVCSFVGAHLLRHIGDLPALAAYEAVGRSVEVRPTGLVIGLLMIVFALVETLPQLGKLSLPPRWLPLGGALSGLIGGISGHQGALRSAFLLRFKRTLTKESFIATNVVIAVLVDVARISVYGTAFSWGEASANGSILVAATLSAFLGAWLGARLARQVTMKTVQGTVAVLLIVLGAGIAAGLIG